MWPKRDFIWLCVVFTIVQIFIVSLTLGNSTRAGENLNFAATAVSVVLAVIAIVITLVDVAGQKHNVMQLQETTGNLQISLVEVRKLVENTAEALESLKETTEEYRLTIQENKDLSDRIIANIDELARDIKKEGKESNSETENEKQILIKKIIDNVKASQVKEPIYRRYQFHLRKVDPDGLFDLDEFKNFIKVKLGITNYYQIRVRRFADLPNDYLLIFNSDKELSRIRFNEILSEYPQSIMLYNTNMDNQ